MELEKNTIYGFPTPLKKKSPRWGYSSRFFIPNEDARMVCGAISALKNPVRNPLFVGGSGMVMLEAMSLLKQADSVTYMDISQFQVNYFIAILKGLSKCISSDDFRRWFIMEIYPLLRDHFIRYKQHVFEVDDVISALYEHFGLYFFFKTEAFLNIKSKLRFIRILQDDMSHYFYKLTLD